jgi:hypothetical protein
VVVHGHGYAVSSFLCSSGGFVHVYNDIEFSDLLAVGWFDFSTVWGADLLLPVCLVAILWLVFKLFRWVVGLHWLFLIFCGFGFSGGDLPSLGLS